jgi:HEXXH motif-containing protein
VAHARSATAAVTHLFEPGGEGRSYAPWRPDPRPLLGPFHRAYAHLGVADLWNRRRLSGTAHARGDGAALADARGRLFRL